MKYWFLLLPSLLFGHFKVIVLGCRGGPTEGNTSCYLLAHETSSDFIALDAGTLLEGIHLSDLAGNFEDITIDAVSKWTLEGQILRDHIHGYLISHAHLDHVAGLVLNSPDDTAKPIYGLESTIDFIRDNLFNRKIWPNFGNEGEKPCLGLYTYTRVRERTLFDIEKMGMRAEAFPLSHPDGYISTAFLIQHQDHYVLYCGDTAPDFLETGKKLEKVWQRIAPIIRQGKLHGIFLECSFSNHVHDNELFGHLNPKFVLQELSKLAALVDPSHPEDALKGLKILITHIKIPPLKGPSPILIIEEELKKGNSLGVEFLFLNQTDKVFL